MKINPLIAEHSPETPEYLYSLNLHLSQQVLKKFEGIQYVLMQGSEIRAHSLAKKIAQTIFNVDTRYFDLIDLTPASAYACYRIGNILSVSHGMGSGSMMTFLHDISKVMYFSGNHDFEYIRIGTSGGIGISPGVVVITDEVYMANLNKGCKSPDLDADIIYPTCMDTELSQRILNAQPNHLSFEVLRGNSIAADDFYLGQARFDGAITPMYDEKKRQAYFKKIQALSILNIEMESAAFASFCYRAEIPAAMVAVTLINRLLGDQLSVSSETLGEWSDRSQQVVMHYLVKRNQDKM
jgi:uridine phosphorylase